MAESGRKEWIRPSPGYLACFKSVWEWIAKPYPGPEDGRYVRVLTSRIVGMTHPSCEKYGADWRPLGAPDSAEEEWRRLTPLLKGRASSVHGAQPPVTAELLVDENFMRSVELYEIDGLYFVSNSLHRIAAAKILGRPQVLGFVLPFTLRTDAPATVRAWLRELRPCDMGRG